MPLTQAQLEDLQTEYFAEDVPIDLATMSKWTEEEARVYFDSGGAKMPGSGGGGSALSGLFALPPSKLSSGSDLSMASLAGKPVFIMNVASK